MALQQASGYSPYNCLLVLLQRPAATFVMPGHAWEGNPYAMADIPDPETSLHWIAQNAMYDGVRIVQSPLRADPRDRQGLGAALGRRQRRQ